MKLISSKILITDDDLLITMNDMFFAGSETTAASIRWLILYMALNPEVILISKYGTIID